MRVTVAAIAALFVVAVPGGSVASTKASVILELRVGSLDAAVTLDPTGRLLNPNCPENTCKFSYAAGTQVRLTAINGASSSFVEWGGRCSGSYPTCDLTVGGNRYVLASFSRLTLQYGATKGGHVELTLAGNSCGSRCVVYSYGTTDVGLRAVADDSNYRFDRWGGSNCATIDSDGCVIRSPMRWNRVVYAYFERTDGTGEVQSPLVGTSRAYVRLTGSGTVTAKFDGRDFRCSLAECRIYPLKGAAVVLTATESAGWRFYGWSGRCTGAGAICIFSNQAPKYYPLVRATFVRA